MLRLGPGQATEGTPETLDGPLVAKLAEATSAAFDIIERELGSRVATLETQATRHETAMDNISQGVCFFDVSSA